jgi:hypothetical protein
MHRFRSARRFLFVADQASAASGLSTCPWAISIALRGSRGPVRDDRNVAEGGVRSETVQIAIVGEDARFPRVAGRSSARSGCPPYRERRSLPERARQGGNPRRSRIACASGRTAGPVIDTRLCVLSASAVKIRADFCFEPVCACGGTSLRSAGASVIAEAVLAARPGPGKRHAWMAASVRGAAAHPGQQQRERDA